VLRFVDFKTLAFNGIKFIPVRLLYLAISVQKSAAAAKHNRLISIVDSNR